MVDLDGTQLDRYSRQVIVDEVGPAGQEALLEYANAKHRSLYDV